MDSTKCDSLGMWAPQVQWEPTVQAGDRGAGELVEPRGTSLGGKEQVYDGSWITAFRILHRPHQLFGSF